MMSTQLNSDPIIGCQFLKEYFILMNFEKVSVSYSKGRKTPLMYRQQAEPHEPVARAAHIACLVTCHMVHVTREHSESHEHEHE
jgi:hypothetical protein